MEARIEELEAQLRDVQAQVTSCMTTVPPVQNHVHAATTYDGEGCAEAKSR